MKSLDTSQFLTGIGEVINYNNSFFQPLITPLVSINSVCNQNYFDYMLANLNTQIIDHQTKVISNVLGNNDNLINPINLNFLDSDIKPINFDIFNNLSDINYGFKPLSIPNNNYTFSTNKKDSNILNVSSNLINYSRISVTNQLTTSIPDTFIDLSNSNSISNTFFNSSCYSFQTDNFLLQNSFKPITLIDINQNLFSTFKQPVVYSPLNYNYLEQNSYIDFNPFLYPEQNNTLINISTKEIINHLNHRCVVNISSNKQDIKRMFKSAAYSFSVGNNLSIITLNIEPLDQNIELYTKSIKKEIHKQNQGKGGRKKREAERLFFISKFNKLRELNHKSKDKDILHKIWIEHSYKELSALSKTRGITTLTEWYRKYIAKSA